MRRTLLMVTTFVALAWATLAVGCAGSQDRPDFPPIEEPQPDGAYCFQQSDCRSGICAGRGCDTQNAGRCMPQYRICLEEMTQFCTCEGQTVELDATCPDRRYSEMGRCER